MLVGEWVMRVCQICSMNRSYMLYRRCGRSFRVATHVPVKCVSCCGALETCKSFAVGGNFENARVMLCMRRTENDEKHKSFESMGLGGGGWALVVPLIAAHLAIPFVKLSDLSALLSVL